MSLNQFDTLEQALATMTQVLREQEAAGETGPAVAELEAKVEAIGLELHCIGPALGRSHPTTVKAEESKRVTSALLLQFSRIHETWFTKRPYPWFEVMLVDTQGNNVTTTDPADPSPTLNLRVLTAAGEPLSTIPPLSVPFVGGRALVADQLRFPAVSSQNGGDYRIEASFSEPFRGVTINPALSPPIRVLSERLFAETKAENVHQLSHDDRIIRIRGIGKKYAHRFGQHGIFTVRDMARLHPAHDTNEIRAILSHVGQEKGTLTLARLVRIITDCRWVCSIADRTTSSPDKPANSLNSPQSLLSGSTHCPAISGSGSNNSTACAGDAFEIIPGLNAAGLRFSAPTDSRDPPPASTLASAQYSGDFHNPAFQAPLTYATAPDGNIR